MPKKHEIIDYFFTMYGSDFLEFTNELKNDLQSCGIPVSNKIDVNDLMDLVIKNVNIK
jgi:hypothetical protein